MNNILSAIVSIEKSQDPDFENQCESERFELNKFEKRPILNIISFDFPVYFIGYVMYSCTISVSN